MSRFLVPFTLFALLVMIAAAPAFAGMTGSVNGYIKDENTGSAIPGLRVTLRTCNANEIQWTQTDRKGFFSFASVAVGPAALLVTDPDNARDDRYMLKTTQCFMVWSDQVASTVIRVHRWQHNVDDSSLYPARATTVPPFGGYEASSAPRPGH